MELKKARLRKGMNREELAEAVGVTYKAVGNWERGDRSPRPRYMARLADVLDTTVDELFFEESAK